MSRVFKPENKYMNTAKYDSSVTGPSKKVRIHCEGEDYHKARTIAQWLFVKYDMSYSAYRNKSKSRRDELRAEFESDTGVNMEERERQRFMNYLDKYGIIRVAFCCHGNICRSTLCESVFTNKVKALGLSDRFIIDSFATSREEIGNPPHRGTVTKLSEMGIPLVPHRAKQITLSDYDKFDYIIGMDTANIRNLNRLLNNDPEGKIYKLLSFSGSGRDIADPWYTGNFDETYEDVNEGCEGFLEYLRREKLL